MARRGTTARIDSAELEKLCAMQATDEEIAAWFGVSTRTIERRRKVRKFADVMDRGRARGRLSVRRMQMKLLEAGNATMGVWLGKQYLGQSDQLQHNYDAPTISACLAIPRSFPMHHEGSAVNAHYERIEAHRGSGADVEAPQRVSEPDEQ